MKITVKYNEVQRRWLTHLLLGYGQSELKFVGVFGAAETWQQSLRSLREALRTLLPGDSGLTEVEVTRDGTVYVYKFQTFTPQAKTRVSTAFFLVARVHRGVRKLVRPIKKFD